MALGIAAENSAYSPPVYVQGPAYLGVMYARRAVAWTDEVIAHCSGSPFTEARDLRDTLVSEFPQ